MAQYDVFTNPSGSAAEGIPYVVAVQSHLLDALATRLTMPLAVLDVETKVPTVLCPVIMVKGQRLHALAHYAAPLPAKALRRPVDNVASQAIALVSALDVVLSGIWSVRIRMAALRQRDRNGGCLVRVDSVSSADMEAVGGGTQAPPAELHGCCNPDRRHSARAGW